VSIDAGEQVILAARPLPGESVDAFVKRFTDDPKTKKEILDQNEGVKLLKPNVFVRVPYRLLSDNYRKIAMEALFPQDRADARGWDHLVTAPAGHPESLWRIAEWFTGDGANYRAIRSEGQIASLETEVGQTVHIPARLLLPGFHASVVSEAEPPPLEFASDEQGRHAIYRLKRGEALYSAVVVRFTGRVHAEDVNAKAVEIATRSGISDVHAIPVGFAVKIPIEDLSPEFRPPDDPARIEDEKIRLETAQFVNRVRAADLSGVTFVLDAGHGGRDAGAAVDGVGEANAVYDLACRVESLLTQHTRGKVILTVRGKTACGRGSGAESSWRSARVMTTPPYDLDDAVAGVNLRWYLANSILRKSMKEGGSRPSGRSFSLCMPIRFTRRSAAPCIPGEKFPGRPVWEDGCHAFAARGEGSADRLVFPQGKDAGGGTLARSRGEDRRGLRAANLPLHAFQPIRRNVIREAGSGFPILRYNRIPARVLVEVGNLNNPEDRQLLVTKAFRDRVARSLVAGLVDFYGGKGQQTVTASLK
jgi:N-acetylmuramoyl-L-alanine amidase